MKKNNVDLFWEHPTRNVLRVFLAVVAFCTLFTFMPKWFNAVCTILLIVWFVKTFIKFENKEEKTEKK